MTEEDLLYDFCPREISTGCYNVIIDEIPVYNFIRRLVRKDYLKQKGINHVDYLRKGSLTKRFVSILKSCFHLMSLPSNIKYVYKTFRLEIIDNVWMDKFYDPIIEECQQKDDYIILETNHGRIHSNRLHKDNVYYDDMLLIIAEIIAIIYKPFYARRNQAALNLLYKSVSNLLDKELSALNTESFIKEIVKCKIRVKLYSWLLKRIGAQRLIGASRTNITPIICSAKQLNIKVFELQHGIGYGEDVTYGGYRDNLFIPDLFMLFGDVHPRNVYGIDESRIVNIGWALIDYVKKHVSSTSISESDILILSQPNLTYYVIDAVIEMADSYREKSFYIRFHPMEKISDNIINRLKAYSNIYIQDNSISLIIGLMSFKHVMGVQSTAVYEALSYGKKVGIIALNGYTPIFLQDSDEQSFWVVRDKASFKAYLEGNVNEKKTGGIYSPFDISQFKKLIL